MNHPFAQMLIRWCVLAVGVTIATKIVPGIRCDDAGTLVVVVLLLSFFNAILKPLIVLFTLPFILVTLGLGVVVINALLFFWVGRLVEGFHVAGFWPAVGGALVVSFTNMVLSQFLRGGPRPPRGGDTSGGTPPSSGVQPRPVKERGGDVIDI